LVGAVTEIAVHCRFQLRKAYMLGMIVVFLPNVHNFQLKNAIVKQLNFSNWVSR